MKNRTREISSQSIVFYAHIEYIYLFIYPLQSARVTMVTSTKRASLPSFISIDDEMVKARGYWINVYSFLFFSKSISHIFRFEKLSIVKMNYKAPIYWQTLIS